MQPFLLDIIRTENLYNFDRSKDYSGEVLG